MTDEQPSFLSATVPGTLPTMSGRLSKLLYVHDGDPGAIGTVLEEARRMLHFPIEGSGVLGSVADLRTTGAGGRTVPIRVDLVSVADAPAEVRAVASGQTPCFVGQAGTTFVLLVGRAGLSRSTASASDLRGKIRYGLARAGLDIE